ncbi:MAG: DUF1080 domain-containing protein [Planctomycetota bacterium]
MTILRLVSFWATLSLAALAQTPSSSKVVTDRFEVPAGLEVTLWAETPQLYNPTAMDVDEKGRLWVAEAVDYRRWRGRNPGYEREGGDRIVILEDRDGDGVCDKSTVFVQDEDLVAPMGVLVQGNRVYVSCSPNLYVYVDEDGDDRADRREVLLTGFGGHDHDHGLHSAVVGPDGQLKMAAGNAGPHLVTDRAGWELRSGSIYTGGGAEPADNKPGLVSDDGRVWVGGLVLSVGKDGKGLRVLGHNFRNNYEVAVDSFGNLFLADNDDDGNQGCRTVWVMEGGNFGYFSADGSRSWQADRRPGQESTRAQWHQDDPGVVPAGTINGAGGPTGVTVYEGELLARWIRGAVLNADAGRNVVYAHRPVIDGAGIRLEPGSLIRAKQRGGDEKAGWFRPSDVTVGLDGSVFVADWYDPGVGGHLMRDSETVGRIYRIAPSGAPAKAKPIDPTTMTGAVAAFRSPVPSVRALGADTIRLAGPGAMRTLEDLMRDSNLGVRARAVWLATSVPGPAQSFVVSALGDAEPMIRLTALRALRDSAPRSAAKWATRLAGDPSPAVRREVAITLRDLPMQDTAGIWLRLKKELDPSDRFAVEALGIGASGQEETIYRLLIGETPALEWSATEAVLTWRLHPAVAVPALRERAMAESLSASERGLAIDALAFISDRTAADAMLDVAQIGPQDTRGQAMYWLRHRASNDWARWSVATQLPQGSLENASKLWSSGRMRSGTKAFEVDVRGASRVWLVATDAGDGISCDWANWLAPRFVGPNGEWPLNEQTWLSASAGWGSVNVDKNAGGGPLRIGGEEYSGIGTHASSVIVYEVPDGAERLVGDVGLDDGGTSQNGGQSTTVAFEIWVEEKIDQAQWLALEKAMLEDGGDIEARRAAGTELARSPSGALRVLRLARAGKIPQVLEADIAAAIFKNPDVSIRGLASEFFKRPGNLGSKLPPLAEIAKLEGDPAKGRRLFLSEKGQCSTCHRFEGKGGDVGPDLSQIRLKYGKSELLDHVLNPSAGIALGYETWLFVTEDEQYFTGFVLADGDSVVLKDTQGKRHVLPSDSIAVRERQTVSTMPEGVALGLSPEELADLVAFLREDPEAEPVLGEPIRLFDGKTFEGWTHHLSNPSVPFEKVWQIEDGVIQCSGQPAGYIRTEADFTSYVLTLEWRFDPARGPGNSGVLLRMIGEDKVWPKSIEAQLQHRNAGDIWNIDQFGMDVDPQRTQGRRTVKLQPSSEKPMGEWNRYEITLDRGRLKLVVNGVLQNTATWCDEVPGKICLQSEGAYIELRNIELRPIVR